MSNFDLGPDVISRVRDATDAVEVISEHVRLRRRGRTWEGLCPFHEEKTPSFSVDPEKGLYYCFGCHAGGDVFKFLMERENLSFPEAVEQLARRFGVPLPAAGPEARRRRTENERQQSLLEEAQHWFVEQLMEADGAPARRELERRGFPASSWRDVGFGWAPDDWRQLLEHLRRRHPEGVLVKAGLAIQPDAGKPPYDRFRNRLMFPIRARDGRLVAFGGRILGDGEPKYLNSPEGDLFHKRSTLFNLDRARREVASKGKVIVVEGYFDCLTLQRVGVGNVVATLGTALTSEHARILRRLLGTDGRVLLCYDADSAGRRAAGVGVGVLLQAGVDVAIIDLQGGKDPDDIVRDKGVDAFMEMAAHPVGILDFLLEDLPPNPADRRRAGLAFSALVCAASDPAIRQNLIEELARRLNLRPREIEAQGREPRRRDAPTASATIQPRPTTAPGERDLARILLLGTPSAGERAVKEIRPELVDDPRVRELLQMAAAGSLGEKLLSWVMTESENEATQTFVAALCLAGLPPVTEDTTRTTLETLGRRQRRDQARALQEAIENASQEGDMERLAQLQMEKIEFRKQGA
ncbi:MAG: DNA primase [Thermoanaerobaculales bacterium]|nr:DNA primase [Thermoanaerobaculales bacterium]